MEGVSVNMYKGLRWYWRRKSYEKLSRSGSRRRRSRVELGSARRKRVWRIRVAPKLAFLRRAAAAPRSILVWLRDAYVKLMLGFASSRVCSAGYGGASAFGDGATTFGRGPRKEYDEKMIAEIYRSIVLAQGSLAQRHAPDQLTVADRR